MRFVRVVRSAVLWVAVRRIALSGTPLLSGTLLFAERSVRACWVGCGRLAGGCAGMDGEAASRVALTCGMKSDRGGAVFAEGWETGWRKKKNHHAPPIEISARIRIAERREDRRLPEEGVEARAGGGSVDATGGAVADWKESRIARRLSSPSGSMVCLGEMGGVVADRLEYASVKRGAE